MCRTVLSAVYSPPPSAEGGTPAAARLWHRGATHGNTFSRPRKEEREESSEDSRGEPDGDQARGPVGV